MPNLMGVCRKTKCLLSLLSNNKDNLSLPQKYIHLCSSPKFLRTSDSKQYRASY